jgi:Mce-associated membrane protein
MSQSIPLNFPKRSGAGGDEAAKVSGSDLGHPSVGRRAALLDPRDDPLVTNAGGKPIDLDAFPTTSLSLDAEPVLASGSKRVLASVLDGAIGAGATFLAFGDQFVTVPFTGAPFGSFVRPDVQVVPAASFNDNGWVVGAVLLIVVMQSYLGVTPGKLVVGIAVVRDVDARPIGLAGTTLRCLAHILDSILLIGCLRPLWNAQRKTFADSIMATVVLDTRRPRRHRWFAPAGDSSLDPGSPRSWEAPSAPRWWRPATALCAVACGLRVLFSFDFPTGQASGPFGVSCQMAAPENGPLGLTGGTLNFNSGGATTTRLGVTRLGILVTTQSTHLAVQQPAGRGATTPVPSATPTPTVSKPASQSPGDAYVYGIDQAVAALPIGVRVWPPPPELWPVATTQASTPEGLWLVSHPGAFEGADLAAHPQLTDYGELLLMTPDRSRILSAYPFRGVPPQWLLVTPQAVYCARQGDGGLPNSMVCRVDRSTGSLTVVVFPSPDDFATDAPPVPGGLSAPQPSQADLEVGGWPAPFRRRSSSRYPG